MEEKKVKALIIFYSLEGNTRFIARAIEDEVGADILELKPEKEINSKSLLKYLFGGMQAVFNMKPKLLSFDKNPDNYDLLFIGTPVWAGRNAPAFNTFFNKINIEDKKIGLFSCYAGDEGKVFKRLREKLKGNRIIGEIGFLEPLKSGKNQAELKARTWAKEIISQIEKCSL